MSNFRVFCSCKKWNWNRTKAKERDRFPALEEAPRLSPLFSPSLTLSRASPDDLNVELIFLSRSHSIARVTQRPLVVLSGYTTILANPPSHPSKSSSVISQVLLRVVSYAQHTTVSKPRESVSSPVPLQPFASRERRSAAACVVTGFVAGPSFPPPLPLFHHETRAISFAYSSHSP